MAQCRSRVRTRNQMKRCASHHTISIHLCVHFLSTRSHRFSCTLHSCSRTLHCHIRGIESPLRVTCRDLNLDPPFKGIQILTCTAAVRCKTTNNFNVSWKWRQRRPSYTISESVLCPNALQCSDALIPRVSEHSPQQVVSVLTYVH